MMRFRIFSCLGILPLSLLAKVVVHTAIPSPQEPSLPWVTGPLLAPSGYVVPAGYVNYEPYLYTTAIQGSYNSDWDVVKNRHTFWSNTIQPFIQVGMTSWLDVQILPTVVYNYTDHEAKWVFGDFLLQFDIQLYQPKAIINGPPAIKLEVRELFPNGKYRNLDPKKQSTDVGGGGSYQTGCALVLENSWSFGGDYFLISRLFLDYVLPAATHLKGFNAYGGGFGTDARFFPSQNFSVDLGLEMTLSRNWVFACDIAGSWWTKPHFTGTRGTSLLGTPARLGFPGSGAQYVLAPAIEYNWNSRLGIIGGSWFTFAGRNALAFWSAVFAINYYQ